MRPFYIFSISLVKTLARLIFRIKVFNRDNIPIEGPVILAGNHISYYDPPLVGSFVKREVHFMAKKELFQNKLFGGMISRLNAHPVNRQGFDKKALEMAAGLLKEGKLLMIFPEGTRAKHGDFLPARPGIGMIALSSGATVIPVYIHGANRLFDCLLGREKLAIIYGTPLPRSMIERYARDKEGYRGLADDILKQISALKEDYLKTGRKA